jgi:hypothetical protein
VHEVARGRDRARLWRAPQFVFRGAARRKSCRRLYANPLQQQLFCGVCPLIACGFSRTRLFGSPCRCRAATSDAFDSPQLARTIGTCSKSCATSHSAPRRRRPSGPRDKAGCAGRRIAVATWSSPTQVPTAEPLENQGGHQADYDFQRRVPPAPTDLPTSIRRYTGWRHLGRAAKQSEASRRRGALALWRKPFLVLAPRAHPYRRCRGVCSP